MEMNGSPHANMKFPDEYFKTSRDLEQRVNDVLKFLKLGDPSEHQLPTVLTDASMTLELAIVTLLARYCFGPSHFMDGMKMVFKHMTEDAQILLRANVQANTPPA